MYTGVHQTNLSINQKEGYNSMVAAGLNLWLYMDVCFSGFKFLSLMLQKILLLYSSGPLAVMALCNMAGNQSL